MLNITKVALRNDRLRLLEGSLEENRSDQLLPTQKQKEVQINCSVSCWQMPGWPVCVTLLTEMVLWTTALLKLGGVSGYIERLLERWSDSGA